MTDDDKALMERLEEWEWTLRAVYKAGDLGTDEPAIVMGEASSRIEALSAENERLREQHEAYRQEVSDAVVAAKAYYEVPMYDLSAFIIRPNPDLLVEVLEEVWGDTHLSFTPEAGDFLRAALAKRGGRIVFDD